MPPEAARAALGLPDRALIEALAQGIRVQVQLQDGYLRPAEPPKVPQSAPSLPPRLVAGVRAVLADLAAAPFMAPEAGRLRELGLDPRAIAAAARAGLLLRVTEQIVLAPGAEAEAARILAGLPQPFTTAEARQALGTTRRVAIPLLEYLDRAGITQRLPDDRRRLRLTRAVRSEAAELGRAAQGVGHPPGGAEGVEDAQEKQTAAVDAGRPRRRLVGDRDRRVRQRALPHGDAAVAVALHLVAGAEPAAEHLDDLARRHVLARHPYLRHGLKGSAAC